MNDRAIKPFDKTCRSLHIQFLKTLLAKRKIDHAFDVGANTGQTRDFLREEIGFRGHIISFEPNPDAFNALRARHKPEKNWQAIRVALGPDEGIHRFNVTANNKFSSFLEPHKIVPGAGHTGTDKIDVQVHRLDRYVAKVAAKVARPRIFLKLDTQGYDLEVMKGIADEFLDAIAVIQIELTVRPAFYANSPRMPEAMDYLGRRGYSLAAVINTLSDPQYRAIEMVGIFVR